MKWHRNGFWMHDQSPALITWIKIEHSKRMSAHHIQMLCSMIASTGTTLKKLQVSTLENINIERIGLPKGIHPKSRQP
jgi:hypothetical protein